MKNKKLLKSCALLAVMAIMFPTPIKASTPESDRIIAQIRNGTGCYLNYANFGYVNRFYKAGKLIDAYEGIDGASAELKSKRALMISQSKSEILDFLRHSYASALIQSKEISDLEIAEALGHSSAQVTKGDLRTSVQELFQDCRDRCCGCIRHRRA